MSYLVFQYVQGNLRTKSICAFGNLLEWRIPLELLPEEHLWFSGSGNCAVSFSLWLGLCVCLVTANPSPLLNVSHGSADSLTPAVPLVVEQLLWLQSSPTPEEELQQYLGVMCVFS